MLRRWISINIISIQICIRINFKYRHLQYFDIKYILLDQIVLPLRERR